MAGEQKGRELISETQTSGGSHSHILKRSPVCHCQGKESNSQLCYFLFFLFTVAHLDFSKWVKSKEEQEEKINKGITLIIRQIEIFFDLQRSSECQSNKKERSILWLQTSFIKLRSAIPLINLVYNILRELLGILSIFVSHFCFTWSLSTLIFITYHCGRCPETPSINMLLPI